MNQVAVVGFGYIGSVIAAVLADRGASVVGIDTNPQIIDEVSRGTCTIPEPGLADLVARAVAAGRLSATADPQAVRGAKVVLITVGTPLSDDFSADLSHLRSACAAVAPYIEPDAVVMIKSTVPPGTTRLMYQEFFMARGNVRMAFSPERLAEGQAIRDLLSIPILVGGIDRESSTAGTAFWREYLPVDVSPLSSPEATEMVKLADNLWIDLNIALANELAKLVDALPYPVDVMEIISGANTLKKGQHYVNILYPANGVGGYCLTKDPWFVDALGRRSGLELKIPRASREINDSMPEHVYARVRAWLSSQNIPVRNAKIAILGFAFKGNSGDCRFTPVAPLVQALRDNGYGENLRICDPLVTAREAERHRIRLEPHWQDALNQADAVLMLCGHDEFSALTPQDLAMWTRPGALIYDGRMYFSQEKIQAIRETGLHYIGVGR